MNFHNPRFVRRLWTVPKFSFQARNVLRKLGKSHLEDRPPNRVFPFVRRDRFLRQKISGWYPRLGGYPGIGSGPFSPWIKNRPSGVEPVEHTRKRNRLAHVLQSADPGHGSLDAHAEAGVRDAAVLAEIKIPLESFFGQIVLMNALQEQVVGGHALRSADD